jgi:hypothetical protein
MDHATRPYHCPACNDTYPGRAAYLSHPCVARVLPYVPSVATAEEPDEELKRVATEGARVMLEWSTRVGDRLTRAFGDFARALTPALQQFGAAMMELHDAIEAQHPGLCAELERQQRARERALRRSRRNSAAPARRGARR